MKNVTWLLTKGTPQQWRGWISLLKRMKTQRQNKKIHMKSSMQGLEKICKQVTGQIKRTLVRNYVINTDIQKKVEMPQIKYMKIEYRDHNGSCM